MKRTIRRLFCLIFLTTLILPFNGVFGQPMRTTRVITLYSQPNLKAPAPTYPPARSLVVIRNKVNDQFWEVLYWNNLLYMHESSKQYCVPADSAGLKKADASVNPFIKPSANDTVDSFFNMTPLWLGKYGVKKVNQLSPEQCQIA